MRETIHSLLTRNWARRSEMAIVHRRGLRSVGWSFEELARRASQFAWELESRGIGFGERVILWGENSPEWVAAFYGCLLRGAVVVPLDAQSAPDFVRRVQQQVKARFAVAGNEQLEQLQNLLPVTSFDRLGELIDRHPSVREEREEIPSDHLAEIIYTSGTTAEPKGVCLTHRNLLANIVPLELEIDKYLRYERMIHPLRILCLLPLSHVFGQFMGIFVPALLGTEVHYQSSLNPTEILATIKSERISVLATVPRVLDTLREKILREYENDGKLAEFHRRFEASANKHFLRRWWIFRDLHRKFGWKFWAFVSGGATLPEEAENFWQRVGIAVVQGYGMTETASLISLNHPFKTSKGSIGKILPGHEIKLDRSGEILVRGENISAGYWREGVQPLTGEEGWLSTGDVGALDDQGNLFFKGRKKEVIVTAAGINLHPEDLEAALNQQPEVKESCVVGIEGAQGPEPLAVLLLKSPAAKIEEIVRRANLMLNPSQQIRRWLVWPEPDFPRTSTRKVRRAIVKEKVLTPGQPISRPDELTRILRGISDETKLALSPAANLSADLKLDSLGRVALLSAIEDRYQIELDEAAITPQTTVADLERMIQQGAAGSVAAEYPYPNWARWLPVRLLRFMLYYLLVLPFVTVMCRPRIRGQDNLKSIKTPALIIANHISMVDPAMILVSLPCRFRHRLAIAMAGERLRSLRFSPEDPRLSRRLLGLIQYLLVVLVFNVFPLPQKSGFRRSFGYAGAAVDAGSHLLVFPEGRTTDDGRLCPFMAGIGLLVSQLEIPVVPLKIEGLFDLAQRRRYFSRPGTVTITIGEPVSFARGTDPAEITRELEDCVRRL